MASAPCRSLAEGVLLLALDGCPTPSGVRWCRGLGGRGKGYSPQGLGGLFLLGWLGWQCWRRGPGGGWPGGGLFHSSLLARGLRGPGDYHALRGGEVPGVGVAGGLLLLLLLVSGPLPGPSPLFCFLDDVRPVLFRVCPSLSLLRPSGVSRQGCRRDSGDRGEAPHEGCEAVGEALVPISLVRSQLGNVTGDVV